MKIDTTALCSDYDDEDHHRGDDDDEDDHLDDHDDDDDDDDDCFTENCSSLTSVRVKSIAPSHCPFILPSHSIDPNDSMQMYSFFLFPSHLAHLAVE